MHDSAAKVDDSKPEAKPDTALKSLRYVLSGRDLAILGWV